jgi:RNA-directed DNA polymerase
LTKYFNRIQGLTETKEDVKVLISIIVDISYKNPRTYAITTAILSKLFTLIDNDEQRDRILNDIQTRFNKIPNTGILKIWIQRITIKLNRAKIYDEKLCNKVNDSSIIIWNSDWMNDELKAIINSEPFINEKTIESINSVVDVSEVQLFESKSGY